MVFLINLLSAALSATILISSPAHAGEFGDFAGHYIIVPIDGSSKGWEMIFLDNGTVHWYGYAHCQGNGYMKKTEVEGNLHCSSDNGKATYLFFQMDLKDVQNYEYFYALLYMKSRWLEKEALSIFKKLN